MAKFNPDENYQPPKEYRESRPISDLRPVEADKSLGTALEGIGNVIKGGLSGGYEYLKAYTGEKAEEIVDRRRTERTDALNAKYAEVAGGKPGLTPAAIDRNPIGVAGTEDLAGGPTPGGDTMTDISSAGKAPTPAWSIGPTMDSVAKWNPDIERGIKRISTIEGAKAKGQVSPTQYWGLIDTEVKDLRDRFPGMRQEIDQAVSSLVGTNPANAYITSISSDINSWIKANATDSDKTLAVIKDAVKKGMGDPEYLAQLHTAFKNGQVTEEHALSEVNKLAATKYKLEIATLKRAELKGNEDIVNLAAKNDAFTIASSTLGSHMSSFQLGAGIVGMKGIEDYQTAVANKTRAAPSGDEVLMQRQRVDVAKQKYITAVMAQFDDSSKGRPITSSLEGKRKEALQIASDHAAVFDLIGNNLSEKSMPIASMSAMMTRAMTEDANKDMFNEASMRRFLSVMNAPGIKDNAPLIQKLLTNMFSAKGDNVLDKIVLKATVGTLDVANPADPKTVKEALAETKAAAKAATLPGDERKTDTRNAAAYMMHIKQVTDIGDTGPGAMPDATKITILKKSFEEGLIDKFAMDQPGIKGKYYIWDMLSKEGHRKEIERLDKLPGGEGIAQKHLDWMKRTFLNELFPRDFLELKARTENKNVTVGWDEKNSRWDEKVKISTATASDEAPLFLPSVTRAKEASEKEIGRLLARINKGFDNLSPVLRANGEDPSAFMYSILTNMGFAPVSKTSDAVPVMQGFGPAMMSGIEASRKEFKAGEASREELKKKVKAFPGPQ